MARLSWILGVSLLGAALADPALAQSIVPDGTLGPEQSLLHTGMLGSIEIEQIEGGATRGPNLFHSFEAFGVEAGKAVYFANPMGIGRIFGRVTGSAASRIDGTLGVLGQADLFLLNPNGVLFGPGARLDLSGSFLASTAESFEFGGGLQFNAVNPQPAPLLNIALRPGLQHGLGDVVNEGELRVSTGESLTLIGNTARNQGLLAAPGGNIALLGNLVSLKDGSTVDVSSLSGGGQVFIGGAFQGQGITPRATRTFVGPEAMIKADAISQGNGGEVIVWADQDTRFYGQVSAQGGATGGNGGLVEVSGKDALQYDGRVNTAAANGIGGRLLLDPTNIEVVGLLQFGTPDLSTVDEFSDPNLDGDRTQVSAFAINQSNADVVLQATNDIDIQSPIMLRRGVSFTAEAGGSIRMGESFTFLPGLGANGIQAEEGNISLTAGADISLEKSVIRSDSSSAQNSGEISLLSNRLILGNSGQIGSSASGTGNAGNIRIQASEVLLASTDNREATILTSTRNAGGGRAGNIEIESERLVLRNGSSILSTTIGAGDAGNITISSGSVLLEGLAEDSDANRIIAANLPGSTGKSGTVQITATKKVLLLGGASVYAGTSNDQASGLVEINAPEIELSGFPDRTGFISTEVVEAGASNPAGSAGQIRISTERLTARDNARISASSRLANGGDIEIEATEGIDLSNQGLIVSLGNQGGDIRVEAGALHLANRSEIQSVGLGSDAGDLDIQVQRGLRLTGGSQIGSNSLEGRGGQVSVTAGNIDIRETSIIGSTTLAGDQAGSLNIAAQESITLDQGLIQTTSFNGGGDIFITTQNGDLRLQQSSGIVTSSIGESNTGNVTLEIAGDIIGSGISLISTSSFSTGASGGININARSLNLSQASQVATAVIDPSTFDFSPALLDIAETLGTEVAQLFEEAFARGANSPQSSSGLAGNIDIRVADTVLLDSQAVISTVSTGRGSSGRLAIQAQDLLLNDRSQLLSESQGIGSAGLISASLSGQLGSRNSSIVASSNQGRGGNISISSDSVFLAESSLVGSSVFDSTGDSGDISIQSNSFVAIEDSDILANAEQGLGGEIRISSPAFLASLFSSGSATPVGRVFGSFEQFRGNSRVDISAEAALPENSGTTEFPRVDPAQGLQTFPVVLPDPSSQIDRSCKPQSEASKSAFFITGRSGLPQRPSEPMESRIGADQAAWVPLPQSLAAFSTQKLVGDRASTPALAEASYWQRDAAGRVRLLASATGKARDSAIAPCAAQLF